MFVPHPIVYQNVVQIGNGLAGASAANAIANALPLTHRLILISNTDAAYYSVGALRGAVVPGWEEKIVLNTDTFFSKDSRHILLSGTNVIKLESHQVTIDKSTVAEYESLVIPFEYAVLAMGSTYAFPCRPPSGDSSVESVVRIMKQFQSNVLSSSSVCIVGAGPVGIEFAGEVKATYPDKQVTLIHSGSALIEENGIKPALGKSIFYQLEALGVKVVLNTRLDTGDLVTGPIENQKFDLGNGESIEADFLMIAYGNAPNSSLVKNFDPSLLDAAHRVKVKPTLQVASIDNSLDHIFVVGDLANTVETKLWVNGQNHATVVATNITYLIKSQPQYLKTYTPGQKLMVVSVGSAGGAGQIYMGIIIGAWATSLAKSRTLFVDKFRSVYNVR